jgi:hypothetical protein
MPKSVPIGARPFVDPGSAINSLRRLVDAAERGDIDLSAVAAYARAAASGDGVRFGATSAVPIAMLEAIRENPEVPARQIVYAGVDRGLWSWEDAEHFEANSEALSERARGHRARSGVYLTKSRRARKLPAVADMFVPKASLDLFCRDDLCDGAKACMALLLALAGKSDTLVTYTSSIATALGRTTRTVRNYFTALEAAGLVTRRPGRHHNTVSLTIDASCRPEPYREPRELTAFKAAIRSGNPALQLLAISVVNAAEETCALDKSTLDRRKGIAAFNLESNPHPPAGRRPNRSVLGNGLTAGASLSHPTTHSTLFVDPTRPIGGSRRPFATLRRTDGLQRGKFDDSLVGQ